MFKVQSSRFKVQSSGLNVQSSNPEPGIRSPELGTRNSERRKAAGLSLVELIVFIAVVGVAVAGVLAALNLTTRGSVDPMIQKQALAIAEAMIEEVQLMPFTYCDPDDAQAATAESATVGPTGCAATVEAAIGPEGGETRSSTTTPFDNVNDYHGYDSNTDPPPGIKDITGTVIGGLDGYRVTVSVAGQGVPAVGGGRAIPVGDSQIVTVTVTGPGNVSVSLHGYRVRYAPNALP